jgi:hypothetical protein
MYPDSSEILIQFWPSPDEIIESRLEDAYLAGLAEFYNSVRMVFASDVCGQGLESTGLVHVYTEQFKQGGQPVHRYAPPEIIEWLLKLGSSSGLTIGVYKLLRLWVESKKGRRLLFKVRGIEIEATQMNSDQFAEFADKVLELADKLERVVDASDASEVLENNRSELRRHVKETGLPLIDHSFEEGRTIRKLASDSRKKARKRV